MTTSSPLNAREIYGHALKFLATDTHLRKQVDKDARASKVFLFHGMVINAFASELFLKCLIVLDEKKPKASHNLKSLYEQLSSDKQSLVTKHWDEGCRQRKHLIDEQEKVTNTPIPRDLVTALNECGDAFRIMRYAYERPKAGSFYITHLPISLRFAVQEVTGWDP